MTNHGSQSQWKLTEDPRPKKALQVRSNVKLLLTAFFGSNSVVQHEFLPQGRTLDKEYYHAVMPWFSEAFRQKCTELWESGESMLVREFLAKNKTIIMAQPPYSAFFTPADFFPLSKTEDTDKRKSFCCN